MYRPFNAETWIRIKINGKSKNKYDFLFFGSIEGKTRRDRFNNEIFEKKQKLFKEEKYYNGLAA
jgi:hypothetical protein